MLPSLKELSDNLLLDNVKAFKQVEDQTIADLVLYLSEVDARKIYRDIGFSSLFSYCSSSVADGGLGYSEGSAYRRIQAARSLKENPEIYELLKDGKLSLCAVAEISKVIKPENKAELLELSQGKPKTEVQKITLNYQAPVNNITREKIVAKRVLVASTDPLFASGTSQDSIEESRIETKYDFTVAVDDEFLELLKEAKDIIGFVPSVEVLKKTLKEFVSRRKAAPRKSEVTKAKQDSQVIVNQETVNPGVINQDAGKPPETKGLFTVEVMAKPIHQSRYIARAVARRVKERDQYQCTFVGSTGKRCSETCGLELDHIKPFALGGSSDDSNLRLLCSSHNQLAAERVFGKEKIESYFLG